MFGFGVNVGVEGTIVFVGDMVGVSVHDGVGVGGAVVGVDVAGTAVSVGVGGIGVFVAVGVSVKVGVEVNVGVNVGVYVGVDVDVNVGVAVNVDVAVGVDVGVGVKVGVAVGVRVGVAVNVDVGGMGVFVAGYKRCTTNGTETIPSRKSSFTVIEKEVSSWMDTSSIPLGNASFTDHSNDPGGKKSKS